MSEDLKNSKPLKKWERFEILFCDLGIGLEECYQILKSEGYQVGKWKSFTGSVYRRWKENGWKARHEAKLALLSLLENPQDAVFATAMKNYLRYTSQLDQEKKLSQEQTDAVIKMSFKLLELRPEHPKYNKNQNITVFRPEAILNVPAVQILFYVIQKFPKLRELFKDQVFKKAFVTALVQETGRYHKGDLLLESANTIDAEVLND